MAEPLVHLENYLAKPDSYWQGLGHRQSDKLHKSLKRAAQSSGLTKDEVREAVVSEASQRAGRRPPPLYIVNIGGSGSHWLGLMLGEIEGLVDAAEVYVPTPLLDEMTADLAFDEQAIVIDGIHLIHAWGRSADWDKTRRSAIVNSAHRPDLIPTYRSWDPSCTVVHLFRDPRDRVLSVTYRKMSFRQQDAPDLDDENYLRSKALRNVSYLKRYLGSDHRADLELAYEEIRSSPAKALEGIHELVGGDTDRSAIDRAVFLHDESNIRAGVVESKGNLYEEPRGPGWMTASRRDRLIMHHMLSYAIDELGYGHDDCLARDRLPNRVGASRQVQAHQGVRFDYTPDGSIWHPVRERAVPPDVTLRARLTHTGLDALESVIDQPIDILCVAGLTEFGDAQLENVRSRPSIGLDISGTGISASDADHTSFSSDWVMALDTPLQDWAEQFSANQASGTMRGSHS